MRDWLESQELQPETTQVFVTRTLDPRRAWSWNASEILDSVQARKILIASEMLRDYPPGFQFETQLLGSQVRSENGQNVASEVCLKFGRDPSFDSERMWFLTNELKRTELQAIQGDLRIDPSFQFSDPSLESPDPLATWIRTHLSHRKIEVQGKIVRKECPETNIKILAKSPSKSTLALLNELMRAQDEATVTRFESIFRRLRKDSSSISELSKALSDVLGDGRLSPEFESSLPVLKQAKDIVVRGIISQKSPFVLIGSFSTGGVGYSAIVSTLQRSNSKPLFDLSFAELIKTPLTQENTK